MTKIDEIALHIWKDVCKSSSVGESLAVKYANALLAELSKDAEPVAHCFRYLNGYEIGFIGEPENLPLNKEVLLFTNPANTAEIEQLQAKIQEQAAEINHLKGVSECHAIDLRERDSSIKRYVKQLSAEQAKVKVLVDALERPAAWEWVDSKGVMQVSFNEPPEYPEIFHLRPLFSVSKEALATVKGEK